MKRVQTLILLAFLTSGMLFADDKQTVDCEIQNLKCIQVRLQKGEYVDLNRKNSLGRTTLHYAVEEKNVELVKQIVSSYPDTVHAVDNHGNSALYRAVVLNQKQLAEILLQYNSDINSKDRNGETVLDIANSSGYTELADLLITKGAIIGKGAKSNITLWVYGVYILISILITIWVARTLSKNGQVFLDDAFHNKELADSVNHLLVVGFYLINLGYITIALKIGLKPVDPVEALEILSSKIGFVILLLGVMHFFNLYLFGRLRKRTLLKKELGITQNVGVVKPSL
ncbi:MAG: ankyrin repeat domain-containing protein [Leptospiraceae bacterium]|nr:ankyrin repeat domain-containing protein [Leptospiraceae bacterium]